MLALECLVESKRQLGHGTELGTGILAKHGLLLLVVWIHDGLVHLLNACMQVLFVIVRVLQQSGAPGMTFQCDEDYHIQILNLGIISLAQLFHGPKVRTR